MASDNRKQYFLVHSPSIHYWRTFFCLITSIHLITKTVLEPFRVPVLRYYTDTLACQARGLWFKEIDVLIKK